VPGLALAIQHVDRHEDDAEARGGEEKVDVLEAVRNLKREPIARREAARRERGSHAVRPRVEIGERIFLAGPLERDGLRAIVKGAREKLGQGHLASVAQAFRPAGPSDAVSEIDPISVDDDERSLASHS
jgi:hypothetical protein